MNLQHPEPVRLRIAAPKSTPLGAVIYAGTMATCFALAMALRRMGFLSNAVTAYSLVAISLIAAILDVALRSTRMHIWKDRLCVYRSGVFGPRIDISWDDVEGAEALYQHAQIALRLRLRSGQIIDLGPWKPWFSTALLDGRVRRAVESITRTVAAGVHDARAHVTR